MIRNIEILVLCGVAAVTGCSGDNNGHGHDGGHSHGDAAHEHDAEHEHEHEHDAAHEHGDAGHHDLGTPDLGPDATLTPEAFAYCDCMLINCHDPFHARWGADDADARSACAAEASGWTVAGSPQTSGDSLECRQYQCDQVPSGSATCDDAFGDACQ